MQEFAPTHNVEGRPMRDTQALLVKLARQIHNLRRLLELRGPVAREVVGSSAHILCTASARLHSLPEDMHDALVEYVTGGSEVGLKAVGGMFVAMAEMAADEDRAGAAKHGTPGYVSRRPREEGAALPLGAVWAGQVRHTRSQTPKRWLEPRYGLGGARSR